MAAVTGASPLPVAPADVGRGDPPRKVDLIAVVNVLDLTTPLVVGVSLSLRGAEPESQHQKNGDEENENRSPHETVSPKTILGYEYIRLPSSYLT